jgi:hypothetical protein
MRMQLQALQAKDPGSVLIARKLHRLGFNSAQKLQEHFSQYGGVKEVLVPHSRVKASPGRRARTRPAAIGFVVMSSSEAAELVIADGCEHTIEGIQINVQAFERRTADGSQDGSCEDSPISNSEESSDQEAKLHFNYDGSVSSPEFNSNASTPNPKARWADISDEEEQLLAQQQQAQLLFSATLDYQSKESQQSNWGRWNDWYGGEGRCETPPRSPSPTFDYAPKVCEPPGWHAPYNNQAYYQNNQPQRRQNGRGRANRGRA